MLDTKSYKMLENLLLPNGGLINHNPFMDDQDVYVKRLEYTLPLYPLHFFVTPRHDIWSDGESPSEVDYETDESDDEDKGNEKNITIFVKQMDSRVITVKCNGSDTLVVFKRRLESVVGVPENQQRIVFAGKELEDGRTLNYYNIQKGCTLHLILMLRGC